MHMQKKSSSVKITLLLKVDLEGFEPLTSRMRTERSPSNIASVHTLCTARREKSTYIRLYKMFCHPNDLSRSQVWSPSRWFSRWCSLGRNMVGGQVSYRPLRCNSLGVQMYRIPIYNKIRYNVKAWLLFWMKAALLFHIKCRLRTRQVPRDSNPGLTDILILSKIKMSNYILVEGRWSLGNGWSG